MKRKQWLLLLAKILFSSTLMVLLYRSIPKADLYEVLLGIDFRYFFPIALLLFCNTLLSAWKWRLFLLADGVDIPLSTLTATYLIGSFYNLFLPSNIGGDSYRIYDIAKKSKSGMRSVASVFADRFSGFIALVSLSLLSSILVARQFDNLLFFWIPLFFLVLLLLTLVALVKEEPIRFFLTLTRLNRIPILNQLVEKFFLSVQVYGANRRLLVQVMLLSLAFQFSVITIVWLLACALHTEVAFFYFSAFVPLITLLEAVPISIFGLGLRDLGYVFFFGWTGMTDLQTRSLALLLLATTVAYSLLGGILYGRRMFFGEKESQLKQKL
jgi:glycosyltransferase 2 family protein